ncbi:MAG TPA: trypsin-like peptidase domain-containing protein [Pyrinomonadaceae bacterium]|nr:trypsin-like peptidase domain-containing protein [Pyrinomonadaceae bacterium]
MKISVSLCACLLGLLMAATASGQTPNRNRDLDALHQFNTAVRKLVSQITPSVVQVLATGYGPVESSSGKTGAMMSMQQKLGSGAIIDANGYIVTNAHVVSGAQQVRVLVPTVVASESNDEPVISRTRTFEARVVGADEDIDLAVLKIEATGLPALRLGDYNKVRQGDFVFAFGSPEGLQDSVTMGVVSTPARQIDPDNPMVFVQSDAATNPGNSGGPLVNVDGELIGINTFILSESGGNEGLGFAIPSAIVAYAYPQLRKFGHLHRGETGIGVQAITSDLAAGLKLSTDSGVIISDVVPGSPADSAGIKVQDIIKSIDGYPVENLPATNTRLFMRSGGDQIKLGVLRGSNKLSFSVPVVELQNDLDSLAAVLQAKQSRVSQLGVVVVDVDSVVVDKVPNLRIASGVLVAAQAIDSNTNVALQPGDVIHTLNGALVKTADELRSALNTTSPSSPVVLQIERSGRLMFVAFKLDDTAK